MKKRVLSMLMALTLCLTTLPTAVFADVTENGEGSGGTHYVAESGGTQYETVQEILDNMEEGEITLLDSVTEDLTVYAATTIHMNGHSITGNIDATDSLTLNGGTVDGTVKVYGGTLNMTAPAEAEAAITGGLNVVSGSAFVSGAQVGVKGTLYFDGTDMLIFGAVKAVELDSAAEPAAKTLYGSATVNGDTAAEAGFDTDTYKVGGEIAKKLTNKQVGSTTPAAPSLTLTETSKSLTAGKTAVFTANYTGTDTLNAYVQGSAVNGYFTISQKNNGDGTYTVSVKIDEETPGGTYTLFVHELGNTSVQASATITVTGLPDAAEVNGKQYKSLPAALNAAQNGDTVKLLADHVTDADALNALGEDFTFEQYASIVPVVTKTLTLDLNHKTVDYLEVGFSETNEETQEKETLATGNLTVTGEPAYGRILNLVFMDGALDIQSGEIGGILVDDNGVESPGGGLVCDVNSGSVTISGGTVLGLTVLEGAAVTVNGGSAHAGAWLNDSTLNITGGTFGNVRFRNNGGTIAISGGTFDTITNTNGSGSIPLMPLLADNYAFYKGDNAQNSTEKTLTNVTVRPHTHSFENGKCDCGASYVASVTASGGESTNYTSLDDALDAVKDGDTVTLLSDAKITRWPSLSKAFTLELNGKTATTQSKAELYLHARVTVQDSSNGKTGGMAGTALLNVQSNGDLIIKSGTFNGRIAMNDGKLTIKGGTFNQEVDLPRGDSDSVFFSGGTFANIWYPNSSGSFLDLLADGCAFYDNDGKLVNAAEITGRYLYNVHIGTHAHSFTGGACACGYTCPHTSVDESGACTVCGKQFAASITEGNDVTYYDTFGSALFYATRNDGCTLKLLADVTGTTVMINNPFIFDLNGHSVDALSVDAKATIKDSGTTKGRIGKVTVSNEKVTDLTLGGLLEEGYAFKYGNGYWANDSYLQTTEGSFVTVEKAPIQSVNVYAKDKNNQEILTIAYGATGEVTLVSSCKLSETSGEKLSCAWYKLTDDAAIPPLDGATGTSYTLPADLPAGKHTYWVTFTSDGYSKSAEITITVTKIDLANATVTIDPWSADGKFRFNPYASKTVAFDPSIKAVTVTANGKEDRLSDSDFTYTGATATQVGNYKLTITATDSCANYKGSKTFDWEVVPYQLFRPLFQGSQTYTKTYDGTTTLPGSYTWPAEFFGREGTDQNVTLKSGDYEVTAAEFVSADAGENKPINQTITLKNDNFVFYPTEIVNVKGITTTDKTLTYTNFTPNEAYSSVGTTFNIEKATMPDFDKEVTLDIVNNHADTYTVDLSALLPKLESPRTYGEIEYSQPAVQLASGYYTVGNAKVENGKLILTIDKNPVTTTGPIGTVTVQVTTTNYKPVTLTVNLRAVNKQILGMFVSVATDPIVYGMTLGDIKLSAEATVGKDNQVIPGTIAWEAPLTTVPAAGRATYRWTFTPDDTMHYLTASNTITFLVDKATPTGAPTYAAITTGGKTLADAPLTPNASWPSGTVQWVDKDGKPLPAATQVQANTEYTWSFTPADAANYNGATGSVTLYAVSSGGGSDRDNSGSTGKTETTTKPDGTTVKTETRADGTKIQTETKKDGSTVKTETKKDGSSVTENKAANGSTGTVKTDKHGQTTAETALSSKAIENAKKNGEPVKAPVEVKASRDSNTAPTVKIELPKNSGDTKVEIPVTNVKPGTVAVLVHPDGTEEIVKNSLPTEDGIQLTVNGGATVKIVDNSKDFADTRNHWAKDAIDFVSARGLVSGMNDSIYAPNASTTRAQLWTILARQNDADLNGGNTWYEKAQLWSKEKGISDGTEPNAAINRAQMVTMLWRAAGQPTAGGTANFTDVPADSYYANAVSWAVEGGITAGVGGGRFAPNSTCTRAQIATFLWRAMAE